MDEAKALVSAIDLIAHHMADLTDKDHGFDPMWMEHIAQAVADLAAMLRLREKLREQESKLAPVVRS